MWAVNPPTLTAADTAAHCAKGIRNKTLRAKVDGAIVDFAVNSATLQAAIHAQQLHHSTSGTYPVAGLTDEELKGLYKGQLSRLNSKARHIYDHVIGNALHGLCSYCQHGVVTALDHFIPITLIPALAIDPWNLVPACDRCNKLLLDDFVALVDEQQLHPYAHPASVPPGTRWLHAKVHPGPVAAVTFHADPDPALPLPLRTRIVNQFNRLKLSDLFKVVAARELAGTCRNLTELFPGGQADPVAAHLKELGQDGLASDPNDRRGVMYEALSADDWFIHSGYEAAG